MPNPSPAAAPATRSTNAPKIFIPLIAALVGIGVGYALGSSPKGAGSIVGLTEQACYEAATKKLQAAGILPPEEESMNITSLNGTVTAVSGNTLTIEVPNMERNPLAPATPSIRKVTVAENATITSRKSRDQAAFFRELQAYDEKMFEAVENDDRNGADAAPIDLGPRPLPFVETTISLSDITVGSEVTVSADMDIVRAESFTASSVNVRVPDPTTTEDGMNASESNADGI